MARDVIAFAKGESSFEHVHGLIDAIKPGFEKHGYLCVDFDTSERSSYDDLQRLVNENRVRLLFSMNMAMNTILLNREWLKETRVFLYMLDHPYLVYPNCDKMVRSFSDVHLSYCGLTQARFARRLHPGAARIHCLPHGAVPRDVIPWKARDIPVFFVGNNELGENPEIFRETWREYGAEKMRNLNAMVEICLRNPRSALEDAALSVLGETSAVIELCAYMRVVDRYLRGSIRWQVLERLSRQSADVHVFGKGWEELSGHEESRLVCHGPAPNKEVIERMRRAKIVLNLFPAYYESHERVADGASFGCLVFTTLSDYYLKEFTSESMCFFQTPDSVADGVEQWLSRPKDAEEQAMRANKIFLANHTWERRGEQVLEAIGAPL